MTVLVLFVKNSKNSPKWSKNIFKIFKYILTTSKTVSKYSVLAMRLPSVAHLYQNIGRAEWISNDESWPLCHQYGIEIILTEKILHYYQWFIINS